MYFLHYCEQIVRVKIIIVEKMHYVLTIVQKKRTNPPNNADYALFSESNAEKIHFFDSAEKMHYFEK